METIEFILPTYWASALCNGDFSGYTNEELGQIKAFIKDCTDEIGHAFLDPETEGSPDFLRYHDAKKYGVLATDCWAYIGLIK